MPHVCHRCGHYRFGFWNVREFVCDTCAKDFEEAHEEMHHDAD